MQRNRPLLKLWGFPNVCTNDADKIATEKVDLLG